MNEEIKRRLAEIYQGLTLEELGEANCLLHGAAMRKQSRAASLPPGRLQWWGRLVTFWKHGTPLTGRVERCNATTATIASLFNGAPTRFQVPYPDLRNATPEEIEYAVEANSDGTKRAL